MLGKSSKKNVQRGENATYLGRERELIDSTNYPAMKRKVSILISVRVLSSVCMILPKFGAAQTTVRNI